MFPKLFEKFSNFTKYFRSFRSFENVSKNRSHRDDSFGPKIVEIESILAIFRPFEIFQKKKSLPWTVNHISKIIRELNPQPHMIMSSTIITIPIPYDITSWKMVEVTPGSMTAEKLQGWLEIERFSNQIDRVDASQKFENLKKLGTSE